MRLRLGALALMLTLAQPAWAGYDEGIAAVDRGDYETALRELRPLVEQGHTEAEFLLGALYYEGQGVKQDYAEAAALFRRAAEKGLARAQYYLGAMYSKGAGVEKSAAESIRWYRKAAEQNHAVAQTQLAFKYYFGDGVEQDPQVAIHWSQLAAERGNATGQYLLALIHYDVNGPYLDWDKAEKWFEKAAAQDHEAATQTLKELRSARTIGADYDAGLRAFAESGADSATKTAAAAISDEEAWEAHGRGDYATALQRWLPLAKARDTDSMVALGLMYLFGEGVEKDLRLSYLLIREAAELGNAGAQLMLGSL